MEELTYKKFQVYTISLFVKYSFVRNTTTVSNNFIIATTSNYDNCVEELYRCHNFKLQEVISTLTTSNTSTSIVTIAITAITLYIEFTTKQIPISL